MSQINLQTLNVLNQRPDRVPENLSDPDYSQRTVASEPFFGTLLKAQYGGSSQTPPTVRVACVESKVDLQEDRNWYFAA